MANQWWCFVGNLIWLQCPGQALVDFNVPFQIVRPTPDHKSMNVVNEGLSKLQEHNAGIALLSVVGPYHSGKSFLLNSLLGDMRAFMVGRRTSPETMGIWLCRTRLKAADDSEVWLLDSEGFFGPGVEESYDARVFTVAALLGSHLVYNTVKIIDQQAVNLLELLMTQAQLFGSRSTVHAHGKVPEFLLTETFPSLTWVVEDFVQELPTLFKQEGPIGYLTTYLDGSAGAQSGKKVWGAKGNETRETLITKTFRDVRVAHLFLPATSKHQLQDLSQLRWEDLTQEYRAEIGLLQAHLLRNINARLLSGRPATGPALAGALHFTIQALQRGMFQELPSLWNSWTMQVAAMSLGDAEDWFAVLLQDIDKGEDPSPVATLNGQVESAREKAMGFYRNLIRDFSVRAQINELRQRMDRHFEKKMLAYQERVRRWVFKMSSEAKERMTSYLASFGVPMDPSHLEKLGKVQSETQTQNLTMLLKSFSAPGPRVTLGPAAAMPVFPQSPSSQLSAELRAQLGARMLENERELARIFKVASAAADEAVESELKGNVEMLISKARMIEITKAAEVACWRAFNERLSGFPWAPSTAKYAAGKEQVRKESFEARVARFSAAHEKRLAAFLHTGVQSALASYKERVSAVSMPAPQADIDSQHNHIATACKELLSEHAKDLTDTDAFKETSRNLAKTLDEGRQQLHDKNVEFWKVYSDGATRCAAAANAQRSQECGWLCLFNNVPWVYRSGSFRHLSNCFAKDAAGARMTSKLKAQVFEVWFSKDMSGPARAVYNRFIMLVISVAAILLTVWWYRSGRRFMYSQWPGYFAPYGQASWQTSGYGVPRQGPYYVQQPYMQPQPCYQQGSFSTPMASQRSFGMTYRGGA